MALEKNTYGVEQSNVIGCILSVYTQDIQIDKGILDYFIMSAAPALLKGQGVISEDRLPGLWGLLMKSESEPASKVVAFIVNDKKLMSNIDNLLIVLEDIGQIIRSGGGALGSSIISFLLSDYHHKMAAFILNREPQDFETVISLITADLPSSVSKFIGDYYETISEASDSGDQVEPRLKEDIYYNEILTSLIKILQGAERVSRSSFEKVFRSLLLVEEDDVRGLIEKSFSNIGKLEEDSTVQLLLSQVPHVPASSWFNWVAMIKRKNYTDLPIVSAAEVLLKKLISESDGEGVEVADAARAIKVLLELYGEPSYLDGFIESAGLTPSCSSFEEFVGLSSFFKTMKALSDFEIISDGLPVKIKLSCIQDVLSEDLIHDEDNDEIGIIYKEIKLLNEGWPSYSRTALLDSGCIPHGFFEELNASEWIDSYNKYFISAGLLSAIRMEHRDGFDLLGSNHILKISDEYHLDPADIAIWLSAYNEDFDTVIPVVQPHIVEPMNNDLSQALKLWRYKNDNRFDFDVSYRVLAAPTSFLASSSLLDSIGYFDISDSQAAEILLDKYRASSSDHERKNVLSLWSKRKIKSDKERKVLVERILLPMLDLNKSCVDAVLSYAKEVAFPVPSGVKKSLKEEIAKASSANRDRRRKAKRVLESLGYNIKKGFLDRFF